MELKRWWMKALFQKFLSMLPMGAHVNSAISRMFAGHDSRVDLLTKIVPNLKRHLQAWDIYKGKRLDEITVLEIGTGWDLNTALLLHLWGVREVITVDIVRYVSFRHAVRGIRAIGEYIDRLKMPGVSGNEIESRCENLLRCRTLREITQKGNIRYIAPVSKPYREIESNLVDFWLSTAVFEHIAPADIERILQHMMRVLKTGALVSHIIDLKDHFAYFDRRLPYNHFLRFSEEAWEFWAGNSIAYTNRLFARNYESLFSKYLKVIELVRVEEKQGEPLPMELIDEELRQTPVEEFRIGEVQLVAKKHQEAVII